MLEIWGWPASVALGVGRAAAVQARADLDRAAAATRGGKSKRGRILAATRVARSIQRGAIAAAGWSRDWPAAASDRFTYRRVAARIPGAEPENRASSENRHTCATGSG
jgi:hypothetical protein